MEQSLASRALSNKVQRPAKKKKHQFKMAHVHFHDDGTHTMHLDHEAGHTQSHAVADLDGVHDLFEEHTGEPNSDEDAMEERIHPGIHEQVSERGAQLAADTQDK